MGTISSEKLAQIRGFECGIRDASINFIYHIKGIINNPCEGDLCEECEFCGEENCKSANAIKFIEKFIDTRCEKLSEHDKEWIKKNVR